MSARADEFELYDLAVTVERIDGRCTCAMKVGDTFFLKSGKLSLPPQQDFCVFALQSTIPLLPAKQRRHHPADWMETDARVVCPDPACGLVMRIDRVGRRVVRHDDVSMVPLAVPDAPEQVAPALAGFFRIMELWAVDNAHASAILGRPSDRTFYRWKAGDVANVPSDVIRRIGYVSGIWKALQIVYSNPKQADEWIRRPNRFFGGQTPLERMSAGDVTDLAAVRQYLDAARAPWS